MSIIDRIKKPGHALAGLIRKLWFLFPSDRFFVSLIYWLESGHRLDLSNPRTFTEKIQWLKLYDRKPEYTRMVDKICAKHYAAALIGDEFIIPTLGVWKSFDEIDFSSLPNQFVLKTNHGGGGNAVVICKDKSKLNEKEAKSILDYSLRHNGYNKYREYPYKNIVPCIFAEEMLVDKSDGLSDNSDIIDYKWFCFNGDPKYCQVIQDRRTKETIDFFDTHWNHQEFVGLNPTAGPAIVHPKRPVNLEIQIDIARKLSNSIPFSRIDLYEVNGKTYFGEITFYPASGLGKFRPESYDLFLGEQLKLPIV